MAINEAQIWLAQPDTAQQQANQQWQLALLSVEEHLQYRRFKFDKDRQLYLVAHAMLRVALSCYEDNVAPEDWYFTRNAYGRPEIAGPIKTPLRFNLSHTKGLAACLVTRDIDCGIDVEFIRPANDLLELAQFVFAPDEIAALSSLSQLEQIQCFYEFWTLKESFIKAKGMGLALSLADFAFSLPDRDSANSDIQIQFFATLASESAGDWYFYLSGAGRDHKLAVALRSTAPQERRFSYRQSAPPGSALTLYKASDFANHTA